MRTFVKTVVAAALLSGVAMGMVGSSDAAIANNRAMAIGRYELQLEGKNAGFVTGFAGGGATAEVVVEKLGQDKIQRKHLSNVKYEDITVSAGTGMSDGFYKWIQETMDRRTSRKSGSVIAMDYDNKSLSELSFNNAFLTEIGFPALDAASKDAAKLTVSFAPELTRRNKGAGNVVPNSSGKTQTRMTWNAKDFRLKIDGLDDATRWTSKIDAITLKQRVTAGSIGDHRDYETEPANMEVPNLVITVAEAHAQALYDWHQDFVIKGNNGQDKEKGGTLEFLDPQQKAHFTLTFSNLGITRIETEKSLANGASDQVRHVKATFYVEQIRFTYAPTVPM